MIDPSRLQHEIDRLSAFAAGELANAAGQVIAFGATLQTDAPMASYYLSIAAANAAATVETVNLALDCLRGLRDGGRE